MLHLEPLTPRDIALTLAPMCIVWGLMLLGFAYASWKGL